MNTYDNLDSAKWDGIEAKDGLLWTNGKPIMLPEADLIARKYKYQYAEQLVKALEERNK